MPVTDLEFRMCYSLRGKLLLPHKLMLGLLRAFGISIVPVCESNAS